MIRFAVRMVSGALPEMASVYSFTTDSRFSFVEILFTSPISRASAGELARGDHDLARIGGADHIDQVLHRGGAVAEAHLRRRDAELRVVGGDAEVAQHRDVHAAAQAVAADHGDQRLVAAGELRRRALRQLFVALHRFRARALLLELRDVGARHERLVARAGEHDDPNLGIGLVLRKNLRNRFPHVDRHGVAPLRVVEDEPAHRAFLLRDDPLGQFHGAHQMAPLLCNAEISSGL
jgi:hypothetical protein